MAKLSDLILYTAKVTGTSVATVREISRRLREADLIQTGKGGRYGGADMTPADAASLLTALMIVRASSVSLSNIVPLTRFHLSLRSYFPSSAEPLPSGRWDPNLRLPQLCGLKAGHTFGNAFCMLITSMSNGDFERAVAHWASKQPQVRSYFSVNVNIDSPRPHASAYIEFETPAFDRLDLTYLRPLDAKKLTVQSAPLEFSDLSYDTAYDLTVRATVTEAVLASIGRLLSNSETRHA